MDKLLEQFIAIVEAGSVLGAAETLAVSQPALSYNLRKLEERLDAPLFERTSRGVRLTRYGETMYEHALMMRRLYTNALDTIARNRAEMEHGISIGSGYSSWYLYLKDIVLEHFRDHPQAPINVSLGNALRCMNQLLAGDISLFIGNQVADLAHENAVQFLPLGLTRDRYFVTEGHPLLGRARRRAEVFAYPSTLALPSEARQLRLLAEDAALLPDLPPGSYGHAFTSSSLSACLQFARETQAVLTHSDLLAPHLAREGFVQLSMEDGEGPQPGPMGIYVVTDRMSDPRVTWMVERIRTRVAALNLPPVPV